MAAQRESTPVNSVSTDVLEFDHTQYTSDGRPLNRNYDCVAHPVNPSAFYVNGDNVWHNRHADMPEGARAMANAVETGFKKIDRTPAVPAAQPGHPSDKTRPKFPNDAGRREKLVEILKNKLRLVRDEAIEEINAYSEETEKDLLKRRKTVDKPVAKLLADPEQPMPISFQAQDLVRLYLCEVGTIAELDGVNAGKKKTKDWISAHRWAVTHRNRRWKALANILQLQLPGEERVRRKLAVEIMRDVLVDSVEGH
jgi:hypothetical protein